MGSSRWLLGKEKHERHLALLKRRNSNPFKYAIQEQPDIFPSERRDILIGTIAVITATIEIVIKITVTKYLKCAENMCQTNSQTNAKLINLCTLSISQLL